MFRNKFIILAAMFILFAGVVSAYSDLGGGWCGCGSAGGPGTGCPDCANALNNNTHCINGTIADGTLLDGGVGMICINDPANFSNKVFDLNGSSLDATVAGGLIGIKLVNKTNVTIANGTVGSPFGFLNYGIYLENVTYADIHNVTVNGTSVPVAPLWSAPGIFLGALAVMDAYTSNSIIYNCTVVNNEVTSPGIYLSYCHGNEIWDTTTSSNGHGIWVRNSWNNQIHDCIADNNVDVAMGGTGFACWGSDGYSGNNTFVRVNASSNVYGGMLFWGCSNSTVDYGRFVSNAEGIVLSLGATPRNHNVTVSNNVVDGSTSMGIHVADGAATHVSASLFLNNRITSTTGVAVNFTNTDNNTLINNLVRETSGPSGDAFYFALSADNNTLIENTANNNTGTGFTLYAISQDNTLINSTAYDNYGYGVYLFLADDAFLNDTVLYNNTASDLYVRADALFNYVGEQFFFFNPSGTYANFTNLSLQDAVQGGDEYTVNWTTNSTTLPAGMISFENKFVDISIVAGAPLIDTVEWYWLDSELPGYFESNFEIWKFTAGAWSDEGATLNIADNSLTILNLNPLSDYGILQNISVCPIITSAGTYQLQADLSGAPNVITTEVFDADRACVVVSASDVIIDCNGYTITNDGTLNSAGVFINGTSSIDRTNVTLENCPGISSYNFGVYTHNTENDTLQNITVANTSLAGIYLFRTNDSLVFNTTVHNGSGRGVSLYAGYNNTIVDNYVYDNVYDGFYAYLNSNDNNFTRNVAYNNSYGFFMQLSSSNTIEDNLVYNNTQSGITLFATSDGNSIMSNNVSENPYGIHLFNSSDNGFAENRMYDNSIYGLFVESSHATSAAPNMLADNYYYNNTLSGINITNSTNAWFMGSTIQENGEHGAYVVDSSAILFMPCTGLPFPVRDFVSESNTEIGLFFENSQNVEVYGYTAAMTHTTYIRNNGDYGIEFDNVDDSMIIGSLPLYVNVHDNGNDGVYLHVGSNYNLINALKTHDNIGDGIYVRDSTFNNLSNSEAGNNTDIGFHTFDADDSTFVSNLAYNNTIGFQITASQDSVINDSTAYWNADEGVYCDRTDDVTFNRIESYNNTGDGLHIYSAENIVFNHTTLYNNAVDFRVRDVALLGASYVAEDMLFLNPAGTLVNYTNLSLSDSVLAEEYTINWTTNSSGLFDELISFENKFVNISTVAGAVSIDELTWHWTAGEEAGYIPAFFKLMEYKGTTWSIMNDTPDTGARTLSLYALNPASDYGILQFNENLTIVKTLLSSEPAVPGDIVEFQLVINNTGNTSFFNVEVFDELPMDLAFNGTNTTPYTLNPQIINWTFASLAPNTAVIILLNATVDTGATPGLHWNNANVTAASGLGTNFTNSSNASVQIEAPGIYVQKSYFPVGCYVGDDVTYTLNITNTGSINLTIVVNDTLDAGLLFLNSTPVNTSSSGQTIYWSGGALNNLTPGDSTLIVYNVTATIAGSLSNEVWVRGEYATGNVTASNATTLGVKWPSSTGGGGDLKPLDIEVPDPRIVNQEVTLIVTTGVNTVSNAEVVISYNTGTYWEYFYPDNTDSSGETTFIPPWEGEYKATAKKSGYYDGQEYFDVTGPLEVECETDSDCDECYVCRLGRDSAGNQCVLKEGADCGVDADCPPKSYYKEPYKEGSDFPFDEDFHYIPDPEVDEAPEDHMGIQLYACIDCNCEPVDCLTDDDCPPGQECIDYECTGDEEEEPPEEGCVTNADCPDDQYCADGICEDLDCVCGYPLTHACVFYECCNNVTCWRLYNDNYFCNLDIHECEEILPEEGDQPMDVDVPDEADTGEDVEVTVTSEGDPVGGAQVEISLDGQPYAEGVTDSDGQVTFTAGEAGEYTVIVTKPGFAPAEERLTASEEMPSLWETIIRGIWILLFILILIAIFYVLWTRKKKRRPKA